MQSISVSTHSLIAIVSLHSSCTIGVTELSIHIVRVPVGHPKLLKKFSYSVSTPSERYVSISGDAVLC